MSSERLKKVLEQSSKYLLPPSLIAISLLGVTFKPTSYGFSVEDESFFCNLGSLEKRMVRILLQFGIKVKYEPTYIQLDEQISVPGRHKKTGRPNLKSITTPDFYFKVGRVEFFLEIGAEDISERKIGQAKVMSKAIELKKGKRRIVYLQLLRKDIRFIEDNIETKGDLLRCLLDHDTVICEEKLI